MAKTIDITQLGPISKNSVALLGKNSKNEVGYVEGLVSETGMLKEIDQKYDAESERAQSGKAVAEAIKDLVSNSDLEEKLAEKVDLGTYTEEIAKKADQEAVDTINETLDSKVDNDTFTTHTSNKEVHIDASERAEWNAKATPADIEQAVGEAKTELEASIALKVDQAEYDEEMPKKANQADLDEANKAIASKANQSDLDSTNELLATKASQADLEALREVVGTKAPESNMDAHIKNNDIHVTTEDKTNWNAKVTTEQLQSAKTELQELIDSKVDSMLHYKGSVASESDLPKIGNKTGDVYNVNVTGANYAWNGKAWDKLSEDISGLASQKALDTHTQNEEIHVTLQNKADWSDKYTQHTIDGYLELKADKADVEQEQQALSGRIDAVDAKADLKANQTDVDQKHQEVTETINTLASKESLKGYVPVSVVTLNKGTSYIQNEEDGGILKFIRSDNEDYSKITLWNDDNETGLQLVVTDKNNTQIAKIDGTKEGMYYAKSKGAINPKKDEIVAKRDLEDYVLKTEFEALKTTHLATQTELDEAEGEIQALKTRLSTAETNIAHLEREVNELKASVVSAINEVNDYTANVKQLLQET